MSGRVADNKVLNIFVTRLRVFGLGLRSIYWKTTILWKWEHFFRFLGFRYLVPHIVFRFSISYLIEGRAIICIKSDLDRKTMWGTPYIICIMLSSLIWFRFSWLIGSFLHLTIISVSFPHKGSFSVLFFSGASGFSSWCIIERLK